MLFTAQDLEQYGDSGGVKANSIDEEPFILIFHVRMEILELMNSPHSRHFQVNVDIGTARHRFPGLNDKT